MNKNQAGKRVQQETARKLAEAFKAHFGKRLKPGEVAPHWAESLTEIGVEDGEVRDLFKAFKQASKSHKPDFRDFYDYCQMRMSEGKATSERERTDCIWCKGDGLQSVGFPVDGEGRTRPHLNDDFTYRRPYRKHPVYETGVPCDCKAGGNREPDDMFADLRKRAREAFLAQQPDNEDSDGIRSYQIWFYRWMENSLRKHPPGENEDMGNVGEVANRTESKGGQ